MKNWMQIFISAIVFLAIIIGVRTLILIGHSTLATIASTAGQQQAAQLAAKGQQPIPLDDPRNPNYQEGIHLVYQKAWSKRVYVYPNYLLWDTSPQTTIAIMRNDDPHDVHIVKPGERYDVGNCRCIRFATLGYQTTVNVSRPPHPPY